MSLAPQELPPEQLEAVRAIAEQATTNPEKFKEDVKNLTEGQLNALAEIFLREKKNELSKAVKAEIKARLEALDAETVDESLEELLKRVPAVQSVLKEEKTNADKLKEDVESVQGVVSSTVGGAYGYVKENVLKPLMKNTKDMFIIGPLLGSLSELSPANIRNMVAKKWYQLLSTAGTFASNDSTGLLGKTLFGIADSAKQKLAIIDVKETIEEHKAEERPGETIALDERISKDQWKKMRDILAKDPLAMSAKTSSIIEQRRQAGVLKITISCGDLLKTETEMQEQAKTERLAQLKQKILNLEGWKEAGISSVGDFSTEETSVTNGVLTVNEADLDENGNPKPATRALALREAKKEITAEKIVISKELKDVVTLNWNAPRSVTLPMTTTVQKAAINALIASPQPDRFSVLEIGPSDQIASDEVQMVTRNGSNVLITENNPDVLAAIATGKPKIETAEASPKYKYLNGEFTFMPASMPARPPA